LWIVESDSFEGFEDQDVQDFAQQSFVGQVFLDAYPLVLHNMHLNSLYLLFFLH
jgi:hypothetical protein